MSAATATDDAGELRDLLLEIPSAFDWRKLRRRLIAGFDHSGRHFAALATPLDRLRLVAFVDSMAPAECDRAWAIVRRSLRPRAKLG